MWQRVIWFSVQFLAVILLFQKARGTRNFIKRMRQQGSWLLNMTFAQTQKKQSQIRKLQRIQRKQPGIKRKSDDHVAVWKYKPNGCEV